MEGVYLLSERTMRKIKYWSSFIIPCFGMKDAQVGKCIWSPSLVVVVVIRNGELSANLAGQKGIKV